MTPGLWLLLGKCKDMSFLSRVQVNSEMETAKSRAVTLPARGDPWESMGWAKQLPFWCLGIQ